MNNILNLVKNIEKIEQELTLFNSKRALIKGDICLEVKSIGNSSLIIGKTCHKSIYYNRVKGFGPLDLNSLGDILSVYGEYNITPSFDMTPNNINEDVSAALISNGYVPCEQLVFMHLADIKPLDINKDIKIVKVTEENSEEFLKLIMLSINMNIDLELIERRKKYFYAPNFQNYISYIGNEAAGMGSLFISGDAAYLANDFTFEKFRGQGSQRSLLDFRMEKVRELGCAEVYADVEFGSVSHNNMIKSGFSDVFTNTFWIQK